ncbi:hypothetical protein [Altibacter sp.]|uniref:hypothetical protein n=1 Tax=Altibacter sp. TaxID=2024823 RepID=UPI00258E6E64|nr:hypothetical protein [Altibacter sp.]MCW9036409.1 hypothetical protein [Altibacter sp.]
MPRSFVKYLLLFFLPVMVGYAVMECLTLGLPSGYKKHGDILKQKASQLQVLVLGSSQIKDAVNAAQLEPLTLNVASGDQHHNSDFKLLKALVPKLPNLQTVVLEVSYSHFELPHNGPNFWKNTVYLKYYDVNCFERATYFKDRLIYLSFPAFYSEKIYDHYIVQSDPAGYNSSGFDTLNYAGVFKKLNYDDSKIESRRFKINTEPDLAVFKNNTDYFLEMLDYLKAQNLQVVICHVPMYKSYLPVRHPEILHRRDSMMQVVSDRYSNVMVLDKETDTLQFSATHYWNQSHLNPNGAATFTKMLQKVLDSLH